MSWKAFLDGVARCFDLFGTMVEPVELGTLEDDMRALQQDWHAVLGDMNQEGSDELVRG